MQSAWPAHSVPNRSLVTFQVAATRSGLTDFTEPVGTIAWRSYTADIALLAIVGPLSHWNYYVMGAADARSWARFFLFFGELNLLRLAAPYDRAAHSLATDGSS